ncbi:MAG TPA: hypothetical protein VFZ20_21780 [Longimicrobium sp.]|nr:hypothetical protein [Longimicrobium sp.]
MTLVILAGVVYGEWLILRSQKLEHALTSTRSLYVKSDSGEAIFASALQHTWDYVTRAQSGIQEQLAGGSAEPWGHFLSLADPPAICAMGAPASTGLRSRLLVLDTEIGQDPGGSRARDAVRALDDFATQGPDEAFLRSYARARAFFLQGDPRSAEGVYINEIVPELDRKEHGWPEVNLPATEARRRLLSGEAEPARTAAAVLARYLGARIALLNNPAEAITHFRYAVNHSNHFVDDGPHAYGHLARHEIPLYALRCASTDSTHITTVDLLTGLASAYLDVDSVVGSRNSLHRALLRGTQYPAPERSALLPVLRYGLEQTAPGSAPAGADTFPNGLLWAVSNVHGMLLANQQAPDPRVETVGAAIALRVLRRPNYVQALTAEHVDLCAMLVNIERGLNTRPFQDRLESGDLAPLDSTQAALIIETTKFQHHLCSGASIPSPKMRSQLLLVAGSRLNGGLPASVESIRLKMESAARSREERPFRRPLRQLSSLRRTRMDGDGDFLRRWQEALLRDPAYRIGDSLRLRLADRGAQEASSDLAPTLNAYYRLARGAALSPAEMLPPYSWNDVEYVFEKSGWVSARFGSPVGWGLVLLVACGMIVVLFVNRVILFVWRRRLVATSSYQRERGGWPPLPKKSGERVATPPGAEQIHVASSQTSPPSS